MDNINDLVNAAMAQWDEETNCGETDPAFAGEVGQEIDALVDGLSKEDINDLFAEENPLIFTCTEPDTVMTGDIIITETNGNLIQVERLVDQSHVYGRYADIEEVANEQR